MPVAAFQATARLMFNSDPESGVTEHMTTNFALSVSENLDANVYMASDGVPNEKGSRAITLTFVQGLLANIHHADQQGWRGKEEHVEWIITELYRGMNKETIITPNTD